MHTSPCLAMWIGGFALAVGLGATPAQADAPAPAKSQDVVFTFNLPAAVKDSPSNPGKDLTLYVNGRNGKFTTGIGRGLNGVSHDVDASKLVLEGSAVKGEIGVTVNPDAYVPADGKPIVCRYSVQAVVSGTNVQGTFTGRCDAGGASGLETSGQISGNTRPLLSRAGVWTCSLHMEDAAGDTKGGPKSWGKRGFPKLVFRDGKPVQGVFHGHGGGTQVNYFEAVITDMPLQWEDESFTGPLTVKATDGAVYVFTFAGTVAGDQIGGTFTKTLDGKESPGSRFVGKLDPMPVVPPDNATYNMELIGAVSGGRQLNSFVPCLNGKFGQGMAYCGSFNHTYHDVDAAGLTRNGNTVKGDIKVTVNPDPYIPPDHKPVPCSYAVEAKVEDGYLAGTFTGLFKDEKVSGRILGQVLAIPPVPNPASVHVKLDNGVCDGAPWHRRVYVGFQARDGKSLSGGMSNNKDGWRGTFKTATYEFDGVTFKATIEGTVDTTKGPLKGAYTFKLTGKAVGDTLVGKVDTILNGELKKTGTDFMGGIGPANPAALQTAQPAPAEPAKPAAEDKTDASAGKEN